MSAGGEQHSGNWTLVAHQPALTVLLSGNSGGSKQETGGGQMKIWMLHGDQRRECERHPLPYPPQLRLNQITVPASTIVYQQVLTYLYPKYMDVSKQSKS